MAYLFFVPLILQWEPLYQAAAVRYGVDERIIATIVAVESGGQPDAIGTHGDTGLMQVIPSDCLPESWRTIFADRPTQAELLNPATNIEWGARILAQGFAAYPDDPKRAIASYHTGIAALTAGLNEAGQQYLNRFKTAWWVLWGFAPLPWEERRPEAAGAQK